MRVFSPLPALRERGWGEGMRSHIVADAKPEMALCREDCFAHSLQYYRSILPTMPFEWTPTANTASARRYSRVILTPASNSRSIANGHGVNQ